MSPLPIGCEFCRPTASQICEITVLAAVKDLTPQKRKYPSKIRAWVPCKLCLPSQRCYFSFQRQTRNSFCWYKAIMSCIHFTDINNYESLGRRLRLTKKVMPYFLIDIPQLTTPSWRSLKWKKQTSISNSTAEAVIGLIKKGVQVSYTELLMHGKVKTVI